MSLANTTQLETLEYRFEQMRLALQQLGQVVSGLQSAQANQQQGGYSGIVYFLNPVAIAAGGNVSGQQLYTNIGGTRTAVSGVAATVYNEMASATVTTLGRIIIVGPNPDGTCSVITQSC